MAVQDIRVGGRQSNASYQYTLLSDDLSALREWEPKIRSAGGAAGAGGRQLRSAGQWRRNGPVMTGIPCRARHQRPDANNLLNNAFGQRQISTIYQPLNQYKVVMEVDPAYTGRQRPDKMFVQRRQADPAGLLRQMAAGQCPLSVNHRAVGGIHYLL